MTMRTTKKHLESCIDTINKHFFIDKVDHTTPGHYSLSGGYGGYCLHKQSDRLDCTGVSDVFRCGHVPKKDLLHRMNAFITGIELAKRAKR